MTYRRGANHPRAKLDEKRMRRLRVLRVERGISYRDLGVRFGISHTQARRICIHESWKAAT